MKVIDLLNRIANGEEVPKNIKYKENDYYLFDSKSYLTTDKSRFFDSIYFKELNEEVEIIGEDKKIEKLENERCYYDYATYDSYKDKIDKTLYLIRAINLLETKIDAINDKINEIIDKINSMEVK